MFEGLFQPMHLLVIFGIALLVFGPKKLPNSAKASGRGSAASSQP
jgi:sec-independent protein translocase protein TatA